MVFTATTRAILALASLGRVLALTPLESLSANTYAPAIPNPTGEFAIVQGYNVTFNETSGHVTGEAIFWNYLNLTTSDFSAWCFGRDISEIVFVGPEPTSILYIDSTNEAGDGTIGLYTADVSSPEMSAALVATLPAPLSGLKAAQSPGGDIHFLLYCKANPDGSAYNPITAVDPKSVGGSSARIYDTVSVRIWDHWLTPQRYAVFGGTLASSSNGTYYTFDGHLTNYVAGICDVLCAESPIDTGDASDTDYDISPDGNMVTLNTMNVQLPYGNYSSSQIYIVPFDGSSKDAVPINPRDTSGKYPEAQGVSSWPVFSPDGTKLLYTQQDSMTNPSARNKLYVADVPTDIQGSTTTDFNLTLLAGDWDRSPLQVGWSSDARWAWAVAPHLGGGIAFTVPLAAGDPSPRPYNITSRGTLLGAHSMPDNTLLVTDSKIWTPCDIYSVGLDGSGVVRVYFEANKEDPVLLAAGSSTSGLDASAVSEFYYTSNTSEIQQQAWVVYPEGFDRDETYPLALLTHGGPEDANFNMWGFQGQFNLKVWADQDYVVVAPNPTGSWGWEQNLTDAVYGRWGSYPFWDIVNCWEYVRDNMPFVDVTNGIHAGASFGGYMSNWIQGQDFGRQFKALVTHDGLTLTQAQGSTDQLGFPLNDFLGPINAAAFGPGNPYHDFNPLMYADSWATPHFVAHSSLDYRLPVAEGLSLFNMLQQRGVPSRFLNFPDETHILSNPANILVWYKEIFRFINFYSGISTESPY